MKFGVKKLSASVHLALSLGAVLTLGGVSTAVFAQDAGTSANVDAQDQSAGAQQAPDQKAKTLETVTVTGSRIRRVDVETASPVHTIDRAQIESSGKATLGDLLQEIPAVAGAATNPQVNNGGGDGASTVSLRGLGSQRTLILVNGHRVARNDVNAIPASMVERVEVLKDGASATYGSDAIGGVVNFILRKDYQGAEISANVGESDQNDGFRRGFSTIFGHSSEKGNITAGLDYNKFDGISSARRDFSKNALYLSSGSVVSAGSSRTPSGQLILPAGNPAGLPKGSYTLNGQPSGITTPADYRPYVTARDAYNYQSQNLIQTPQERTNAFALANYQLTDSVQAHLDYFYNKTTSNFAIAPLPFDALSDGVVVSKDNYYNPFGVDFGTDGAGIQGQGFRSRFTTLGQRQGHYATETNQVNAGLRGNFGNDSTWQWDADLNYGHISQQQRSFGYVYYSGLKQALGPSFQDPATGAITCGTAANPITGCTPLNLFNVYDPQTIATLKGYAANPYYNTLTISRRAEANASGELFNLPAGAVSLAVGADYDKEYQNYGVDYIAQTTGAGGTCQISQEACSTPLSGSFNLKEVYYEALVPILADKPFVKSLNITVGQRYSDYSSVGSKTTTKVALEWRPIDDLLLRGTLDGVFRAPTINDLYAGATGSAPPLTDPCLHYTGGHPNACQNVPTDGSFTGSGLSQTTGVNSGSVAAGYQLKPEYGHSYDFGVVYDPSWAPGLSVSADLWRVNLNDTITNISATTVVNACYNNNSSPFCGFIHRFNDGQINYINQPTVNLGTLNTKGIDFSGKYRIPHFDVAGTNIGDFAVSLDTTYLIRYDNDTAPGQPGDVTNHLAGMYQQQYGNYTRWRALAGLNWTAGAWSASWTARYIGALNVGSMDPSMGFSADGSIANVVMRIPSVTYNNFQFGYNIAQYNTRVDVGVDNAFDKQPPLFYQNNVLNANTDVNTYDTIGRYFWARVTVKF
ncbi:TonB-dependent receptor domain-containing protein [Dyella jiangningensis]